MSCLAGSLATAASLPASCSACSGASFSAPLATSPTSGWGTCAASLFSLRVGTSGSFATVPTSARGAAGSAGCCTGAGVTALSPRRWLSAKQTETAHARQNTFIIPSAVAQLIAAYNSFGKWNKDNKGLSQNCYGGFESVQVMRCVDIVDTCPQSSTHSLNSSRFDQLMLGPCGSLHLGKPGATTLKGPTVQMGWVRPL